MVLGSNGPAAATGCVWYPQAQQGHALTFGATRSGKGIHAIIPALLTYAGSMVVIDPKGENAWVSAERRRQLGQRVVILDPWGEVNRRYAGGKAVETVTRFNPLAALDPASPDFGDEVAAVADALITTATTGDTHWTESARELVSGLVAAYVEARPGKGTLRDVRRALLQSQEDFGKLITFFEETTPDGLGARTLAGYKVGSREVDSIRSTAKTQTAFLNSDKLCDSLAGEEHPFDLAELATGRVTLYLVLPLDRLQTHGRWLRLLLTFAIRTIAQQAQPPSLPVLFMLDEFGTVGRLMMVEQAFGLMAGVGVRLWCFLQDLNQLKRDYPASWETFIANCSILTVLKATDLTTSEYFSNYMGSYTHERLTQNTLQKRRDEVNNKPLVQSLMYPKERILESEQIFARPIRFPDEIRRGDSSKLLLFIPAIVLTFKAASLIILILSSKACIGPYLPSRRKLRRSRQSNRPSAKRKGSSAEPCSLIGAEKACSSTRRLPFTS